MIFISAALGQLLCRRRLSPQFADIISGLLSTPQHGLVDSGVFRREAASFMLIKTAELPAPFMVLPPPSFRLALMGLRSRMGLILQNSIVLMPYFEVVQ